MEGLKGRPDQPARWRRKARGESPVVFLQHPHHQGTVFGGKLPSWAVKDDRATCWLRMFPDAISFSGHSHMPLENEQSVWQGEFTSLNAGSLFQA